MLWQNTLYMINSKERMGTSQNESWEDKYPKYLWSLQLQPTKAQGQLSKHIIQM